MMFKLTFIPALVAVCASAQEATADTLLNIFSKNQEKRQWQLPTLPSISFADISE